jgi:ABC-2 type transport system permease protein
VRAQAAVELRLTLRRSESLLVTLGIPLAVLLFFGSVDILEPPTGDRLEFLVPGVLALAIMSTAMVSLGIATGFERGYGVLKRLGSTPLSRPALVAAKTAAVLALEAVQIPLVLGVGLTLGWDAGGDARTIAAAALLGTLAFAGLGLLLAGTLRAEANLGVSNGLYIVLLLVGGMAFDPARLPGWLEAVGGATPAGALSDALRAGFGGGVDGAALGILGAWAAALPLAAAATFRWE